MANVFFVSDTHFGHSNILNFETFEGQPLRNFTSVEEMDEHMVKQWNSVVKNSDTIWHLGDVVINRKALQIVSRLNGRKRLILGNHDIFKNKDYFNAGFEDLHAFRKFDDFVCTHIPVHPESISVRWNVNVHGHLHSNRVMRYDVLNFNKEIDPRYHSVCMEQLDNYKPIALEDLRAKFNS